MGINAALKDAEFYLFDFFSLDFSYHVSVVVSDFVIACASVQLKNNIPLTVTIY